MRRSSSRSRQAWAGAESGHHVVASRRLRTRPGTAQRCCGSPQACSCRLTRPSGAGAWRDARIRERRAGLAHEIARNRPYFRAPDRRATHRACAPWCIQPVVSIPEATEPPSARKVAASAAGVPPSSAPRPPSHRRDSFVGGGERSREAARGRRRRAGRCAGRYAHFAAGGA